MLPLHIQKLKNELRAVISGKGKVRNGTIIQSAARYLKRSKEAGKMAEKPKQLKKQEAEILKAFISKNNLLLPSLNVKDYISEGAEQKVFLKQGRDVLKLNDVIFYNSWIDYFNSLLLHNYFSPITLMN